MFGDTWLCVTMDRNTNTCICYEVWTRIWTRTFIYVSTDKEWMTCNFQKHVTFVHYIWTWSRFLKVTCHSFFVNALHMNLKPEFLLLVLIVLDGWPQVIYPLPFYNKIWHILKFEDLMSCNPKCISNGKLPCLQRNENGVELISLV